MTDRREKINKVFIKLFESLVEAQNLVNTGSLPTEDKPEESTYQKPPQERSVKIKLEDIRTRALKEANQMAEGKNLLELSVGRLKKV